MMRDLSLHTFNIFTMAINMFARVVLVLIGLILSYECDAFIVAPHQTNRLETALPVSISREDKWLSSVLLSASLVMIPLAAGAVSGGGLDYANLDITGQDFSRGNYKGKDFTQVIAKGTTFSGSNLQGCRFYKAYLVRADFSGSDIRGASLEDTSMDEANLKNAIASGAYFGASILDVGSIENADFSEAQIPPKILTQLCSRDDAKGTNPVTGADTRDSLMCP